MRNRYYSLSAPTGLGGIFVSICRCRCTCGQYTLFIIQYELGGASGEEVAVVGGVHYLGVRAEGVLGAVEEEVAEAGAGIVGEAVEEVQREAVAHPDAGFVAPVVGPRLLVGSPTQNGFRRDCAATVSADKNSRWGVVVEDYASSSRNRSFNM